MVKDIIVIQKNETILLLISMKRYFSHLEKYLTLVFLIFKEAL